MLKVVKLQQILLMQLSLLKTTFFQPQRDWQHPYHVSLHCESSSNGLQGGSTLTQQLIKLTYFDIFVRSNYLCKAQEAWLAIQPERTATKQEILTYYINKVYMSNGNYGMW